MGIKISDFGTTAAGAAKLYTIEQENCMAAVTDYGAILVSFAVKNAAGEMIDVALGYDDAAGYENGQDFFGATVGRNANRIGGAAFEINGVKYELAKNENGNNLHSGPDLYSKRLYQTESVDPEGSEVTFIMDSPDGDQGFPGNLTLKVTYRLDADGSLHILYSATSDADTICNPTNHSYFNLDGNAAGSILEHVLTLQADAITATDAESIPTGEIRDVTGTPFDFRQPKVIGLEIGNENDDQIRMGHGYDHNYVLSRNSTELRKVAEVYSGKSGIAMDVLTDLPGIQFYSGNFVKDQIGKNGCHYTRRCGFALETQYYPNSANEVTFAKPLLEAGKTFTSETVYKLYIR